MRQLAAYGIAVAIGLLAAGAYLFFMKHPTSQPQPALTSFADAVEQTLPSVVNIYSEEPNPALSDAIWNNPLLSNYSKNITPPEPTLSRLGSGVIIDKQGHILTNYHVVKSTELIRIMLSDGRETPAEIVGLDSEADLAVLKPKQDGLQAIPVSQSQPRVGDIVLAIGNPFGVGQAVTQGIISGLGRSNLGLATYENYIQTDVAINPGNSGGALINAKGELVGIVTAVFSTTGGYQGISFAIPAQSAMAIAQDLIQYGRVIRGYLGVEMHELARHEADFFGLTDTNGLLITGVQPDSPGSKAGLEAGDVLLMINDMSMRTSQQARDFVSHNKPGDQIKLTVFRRGQSVYLTATLQQRAGNEGD
ncbi:trypsin-like peptidase domain-containing protein [Hahella sp. CR1]|uniref:S1C family serine protease n=1 Tax=Hahella sp. CR1 TaxID=2992807 RepID=UPI0024416D08|nr:trypsin-like peptidase domain-containing protein [Hahella sp. CR1]MDG9668228.1 trypsin-like peptidase domain-containing protein [Hahella sp. CR1]